MSRADFAFHHQFRVRWSETDAQGIVFNARYLDYADIAITEYWRALNFAEKYPDTAVHTHVKKATILWSAPIRPDEIIEVMVRTPHVGRTSFTQIVEIHGTATQQDDLRAEIEMVYVQVDLATHRPAPLPEWLGAEFAAFDAQAD
ncbi:acyl-CoA thioesterase [Sphingorhabdus arenilitoris]|uniref:Acyl-CoA thioesterase n=1 Tax=Sphingorhabdus arenilitoris TaxID=1490041 RepID=A0ABV8RHZ4_9SPHN